MKRYVKSSNYMGYSVYPSDYGWIVRNEYGKKLVEVATDSEAYEYIDGLLEEPVYTKKDYEAEFIRYMKDRNCGINEFNGIYGRSPKQIQYIIDKFDNTNNCNFFVAYHIERKGGELMVMYDGIAEINIGDNSNG